MMHMNHMIWFWFDSEMIIFLIWYGMIDINDWMIWFDMIWDDIYIYIWYDMIWCDMIWYDMTWFMWYDNDWKHDNWEWYYYNYF